MKYSYFLTSSPFQLLYFILDFECLQESQIPIYFKWYQTLANTQSPGIV